MLAASPRSKRSSAERNRRRTTRRSASPLRPRPFRGCEPTVAACDRSRDDLGELAGVRIGVATLERYEDVHPLCTRSLREAHEPERVKRLLDQERHLNGFLEADVR